MRYGNRANDPLPLATSGNSDPLAILASLIPGLCGQPLLEGVDWRLGSLRNATQPSTCPIHNLLN